jgi:hypothetical protein
MQKQTPLHKLAAFIVFFPDRSKLAVQATSDVDSKKKTMCILLEHVIGFLV